MSLNIKSKELYEAMRGYVRAAMSLLANACPDGPPRILEGLEEWRRDSDNLFRRYDRQDPYWADCIRSHQDQIHSLSDYRPLVDIIGSIPEISEQLETLVGTSGNAQRMEIAHVTDHLIWTLAKSSSGLGFDDLRFDQHFGTFITDLSRTSYDYYSVGPMLGLKIEIAPLALESGIILDHMTDDEISRCLANGFLSSWPISQSVAHIESAVCVRVHYQLDKRIGDVDQITLKPWLKKVSGANDSAVDVLHALRVFKDGRVSVPGLLQFSSQWPMEGGTTYQYMNPGRMPWFNKYDLTPTECEEFCTFWKQCQSVMSRGAIANAVRRFSYASDRDRDDDRLVDLMIAAESLFLSDAGTPQERGELRYRLALRAAFFIDVPDSPRLAIYKHMKRAYDARSTIAHGGGDISSDLLKSLKDTPISMNEFVHVTSHLVRIAIKKRIEIAATKGSSGVDWDALIIPSTV